MLRELRDDEALMLCHVTLFAQLIGISNIPSRDALYFGIPKVSTYVQYDWDNGHLVT